MFIGRTGETVNSTRILELALIKLASNGGAKTIVYAGWRNIICDLNRRFGHQLRDLRSFIVNSCWELLSFFYKHLWKEPDRRVVPAIQNTLLN